MGGGGFPLLATLRTIEQLVMLGWTITKLMTLCLQVCRSSIVCFNAMLLKPNKPTPANHANLNDPLDLQTKKSAICFHFDSSLTFENDAEILEGRTYLKESLQPPDLEYALSNQYTQLEDAPPLDPSIRALCRIAVSSFANHNV